MFRPYAIPFILVILVLLLAGCGKSATPTSPQARVTEMPIGEATAMPEYSWSQLLARDAIFPVYDPEFVPADESGYADDELVMGIAIGGEAKAYPVGLLNYREMVDDELAGIPILVTW